MLRPLTSDHQRYVVKQRTDTAPPHNSLMTLIRIQKSSCLVLLVGLTLLSLYAGTSAARVRSHNVAGRDATQTGSARDHEIAGRFAPIFHQGLGDKARFDYITNFDFDGDWRGDNNWGNSQNRRLPLKAYVYYAVSETQTHFFIHYAVFHPQDYKGGQENGPLLSEIIREGIKRGGRYDPTGLAGNAVLAHENDLEGCLVVAAKARGVDDDLKRAEVVYVETMAHDRFLKYAAGAQYELLAVEEGHPQLYVEPRGHGVMAYVEGRKQSLRQGLLIYKYGGRADDPEGGNQGAVSYELLPMATTFWPRARRSAPETFGESYKYGAVSLNTLEGSGRASRRQFNLGTLGSAFLGKVGAPNMARPPWAWFDRSDAGRVKGEWFFDPAATVKRDFSLGKEFSETYVHAPLLGVYRREQ
jgi:hypothetical protein